VPHFVLLKKQRAVGHGFFHEAVLRSVHGSSFRWIYDCGGGRATKAQVDAYLQETRSAAVDILFLSHVHTDHVSGLPHLLKRTKVRRAFLPHTSKAERLLVAMRALADGSMRPWLIRFLANPATWLRENGVDEVTEVVRGQERAPDPRGPDYPDDQNIRVTVFDDGTVLTAGASQVTDQAHVLVQDQTLVLNFLFYVQPAKLQQVDAFLAKLGKRGDAPLDMLSTKEGRRALKQAYEAGWKDINWTSLCVACIPVRRQGPDGHCWVEIGRGRYRRPFVPVERPGWLGMGDAVLKEPSEVGSLKHHFGGALAQVGMYSVPHHGSDDNFCNEVLYVCSRPNDADHHLVRYATAREGDLKHPSPSVSRTFEEHAVDLLIVTEDPETALTHGLVVER